MEQSGAPVAMGKPAPKLRAIQLGARQRPRPDAGSCGGEVSWCSLQVCPRTGRHTAMAVLRLGYIISVHAQKGPRRVLGHRQRPPSNLSWLLAERRALAAIDANNPQRHRVAWSA